MTVVVTPVGTSLFTNGAKSDNDIAGYFEEIKEHRESDWNDYSPYIRPLKTRSEAFIRNQGASASAELQSTVKIWDTLEGNIKVHLLASDTVASRLVAEILRGNVANSVLSENRTANVTVNFNDNQDVIKGLQVQNRTEFLKEGMTNLINKIQYIREIAGDGQTLAINITGGYGASLPYLTIFAQLERIPLYYNFEDSNELITIPSTPLVIDQDLIERYFNVLTEIENVIETEEWPQFKQENYNVVTELDAFIDEVEGGAFLSPIGQIFLEKYHERGPRETWPNPVMTPPKEKDGVSDVPHHRAKGWQIVVNKLCEVVYVSRVSYNSRGHSGKQIQVLDETKGHIGVRHSKGKEAVPLRVETSARGRIQTNLVMEYIQNQLNKVLK